MLWSQLPERRRGGYWPLVTPTLRFAMNTCVLNQTLLHESEEAFRQQTVGLKKWSDMRPQPYTREGGISGTPTCTNLPRDRLELRCDVTVIVLVPANEDLSQA
jgi:hypothetical protein